jgi:integrase
MARSLNLLSAKEVANKRKRGYYADGGGLYLRVSSSGTKSWMFRYRKAGKLRDMGIGPLHAVSLAEARRRAAEQRTLLADGQDPIEQRKAVREQQALETAKAISFSECARRYIKFRESSWKNAKHATQWTNTLHTYCGPVFGDLPVAAVDTALVHKVLDPIWSEKRETARRLRSRIESVLDWATVRGFRKGDNPARWRGHLDKSLPQIKKKRHVRHHPALDYREIGPFMTALRAHDVLSARALEFTILTATRTGEVIGARVEEFDLAQGIWAISGDRMKAGKEHRVPLSRRAVELVKEVKGEEFVFESPRQGPISNMAMLTLLKRMGRADLTVHGFRSTFRDWAAEQTDYPREVAEMALAHVVGDETEAAYRRGDLFDKRRALMNDWAAVCENGWEPAKVSHLKRVV